MADRPEFESPVAARPAEEPDPLTLFDVSATVKWLVRADAEGAAARRLGAPFGSSRRVPGGALVLGSRPGEWILLGDSDAVADAVASLDGRDGRDGPEPQGGQGGQGGLEGLAGQDGLDSQGAREGPAGEGGSEGQEGTAGREFVTALDWTHGRALFRLTGQDAARVLEKVCSLDWSDSMTPDGAVASASVAKVTCDVARSDVDTAPSYLIACDRSFGQYLFDALVDAGDEFGLRVGPALA